MPEYKEDNQTVKTKIFPFTNKEQWEKAIKIAKQQKIFAAKWETNGEYFIEVYINN